MNLNNQVALVTGASRGIGRAIAMELARQGAKVVGTATSEPGAAAITEYLAAIQPGCGKGVVLNVNDAEACLAVVDQVQKDYGSLSILVNNAGITQDQLAMRMKDEEWDAVIATNLTAVGRLSRAVLRGMMKAKHGRIINITSVVGSAGNPGQINYAAAKAGVAGMSRALAREVG
ncbi:MAG: 3-oxoacyl-[acyl-carrier protein] reductase, partial [Burkholderiales bacterium]